MGFALSCRFAVALGALPGTWPMSRFARLPHKARDGYGSLGSRRARTASSAARNHMRAAARVAAFTPRCWRACEDGWGRAMPTEVLRPQMRSGPNGSDQAARWLGPGRAAAGAPGPWELGERVIRRKSVTFSRFMQLTLRKHPASTPRPSLHGRRGAVRTASMGRRPLWQTRGP